MNHLPLPTLLTLSPHLNQLAATFLASSQSVPFFQVSDQGLEPALLLLEIITIDC
jgi:hypothetical protein